MPRLLQPLPYKTIHRDISRVWLFDLDNTLHDASHAIFSHIDTSMSRAVMNMLGVTLEQASAIRQHYWQKYGATMIGMQRHHGIDALAFLRHSHDFDIAANVKKEARLAYLLQQTPGIKYIVTNAPYHYARIVLHTLGITHCFAGICAIDQMCWQGNYYPKPALRLMRQLLTELGCSAGKVTLVEDTLKNLKAAKRLGMRCAHIFNAGTPFSALYNGRPSYVDIKVHSIQALLTSQFARKR